MKSVVVPFVAVAVVVVAVVVLYIGTIMKTKIITFRNKMPITLGQFGKRKQ